MSREAMYARLPALALAGLMLTLFTAIPYASFTSDVANLGLMGNDIINHGYLPTLTYGQSYMISPIPYAYALMRTVLPESLPNIVALKLAGAMLSIPGMLMLCEALILAQRMSGAPLAPAAGLFALMIVSSDAYLFDVELNSSNETSLFLLGALAYMAARMDFTFSSGKAPRSGGWFFLGLIVIFMQISRPMLLCFALPAVALLAATQVRHAGAKGLGRAAGLMLAGMAIGYMPMLAHKIFRAATWPYTFHLPLEIGGGLGIANSLGVLYHVILPRLLTMLWSEYPARSAITALWLAAIGAVLARALYSGGLKKFTVVDWTLIAGQSASIVVMALIPSLAGDTGARRYCLHLVPALAWTLARFVFPAGRISMAALALSAALFVSSFSGWRDRLEFEWERSRQIEETANLAVPELAALDAPVFTDYWDAYLLSFISGEKVRAEAFPWDIVRRYGYFTEEEMRRRTLWVVCDGYAHATLNMFHDELGPEVEPRLISIDLKQKITGRHCEAWELPEPDMAVKIMKKHHPRFFEVNHPPR